MSLTSACIAAVLLGLVGTIQADCEKGQRQACVDCSSFVLCSASGNPVAGSQKRCDEIDKSRPYCKENSGICTDEPCKGEPSELCPEEGIFPQPTNCRQYIYCNKDKEALILNCNSNWVYNHTSGDCVPPRIPADCFQINCVAGKNRYWAYTPDPKIYFYCAPDGPMTLQCPGEHDGFNDKLIRCEFLCPREGRFEYPGDHTKYYSCQKSGGKLTATVVQCPDGLIFVKELERCVLIPRPPTSTGILE
ncbi:uncharacterized protein LOC129743010 [Uranotaenia lowii]|uniref:uncharacterized protein LOC129743010 n=1 Tax=Uranotaenia lowii TaxID=190385 RepID=UPI00247ADE66|nr:uncharacterized protein LOC129743010 [Uranotaenia lowii]